MYLQVNTETECINNIVATIKKLRSLGFTIHVGKSNLIPTSKSDILGYTIESVATKVSSKETKKKDLIQSIAKTFIKIRKLSQVIGKIVAALPGSVYGNLYDRHIKLNKQNGLKCTKENYEGCLKIIKESLSKLTWWTKNLSNMYQKINHALSQCQ